MFLRTNYDESKHKYFRKQVCIFNSQTCHMWYDFVGQSDCRKSNKSKQALEEGSSL